MIQEFGCLRAVMHARPERLAAAGCAPRAAQLLYAVREAFGHVLRESLSVEPIIGTSQALQDYLGFLLGDARSEQLRALYLDAGNFLIRDELVADGSLNQVTAYPRTIVKRALELDAASLILVHNHPSGNLRPSPADRAVTLALARAATALEITLHDHVIVTRDGVASFRQLGFL